MQIIHIILTSIGSAVVLFLLTKIMGNKQISQLNMFDYIVGITIGSIAAEMATSLEDDFWNPLISMVVYAIVAIVISFVSSKSIALRKFLVGRPVVLFDNGKFLKNNFKRAKLDMNEFLTQCRNSGFFNLSQIQTALFESNGKISFLPKVESRPLTPQDMNLSPEQEKMLTNVIIDGKILYENLRHIGKDENWLNKKLLQQKIHDYKKVFLATCDDNGNVSAYMA